MKTSLPRIVVVVGLLAVVAYLIVSSSRRAPEQRLAELSQLSSPVPSESPTGVSASEARPNPRTPDAAPTATSSQAPSATSPVVPAKPAAVASSDASTISRPPMPASVAAPAAPIAARATDADFAAVENDLEHVRMMVREYRDVVGENPVGTNAEIMKAVLGDNLKQAKIGLPDNQTLNGKGELIDRWGTPYFFHQVSKTDMEIRSAGPDRVMWTVDDRDL